MILLSDVRDWLKSFNLFDNYYIGRLDSKKKNSLGVYNLQDPGRREVIGGLKKYEKINKIMLNLYKSLNFSTIKNEMADLGNPYTKLYMEGEQDGDF